MLNDIITSQAKNFAGGVQTVLRGHENRSRRVVLLKGNLVQNSRSESRGISARVTKNGRYGFASTASYTEKDAETVLKAATDNALFLDARASAPRASYPSLPGGIVPLNRAIVDFEQAKIIEHRNIICISCGSHNIKKELKFTEADREKYILTCNDCGLRSINTSCYNCSRKKLYKNGLWWTYHITVASQVSNIVCPSCGAYLLNTYDDSDYLENNDFE